MIQQHSYLFPQPTGPALWHLYKTAQAQEPEESGDTLDVLGEAGKTSRTALILKRIIENERQRTQGRILKACLY